MKRVRASGSVTGLLLGASIIAFAVAASANVLWVTFLGPVHSSPLVVDGVVYTGANRTAVLGSDNNVYALNAATGQILWGTDIGGDVDSTPTLADGVLYIGSGDNGLYALNADSGNVLWVTFLGPVHSSPLVIDGVLYTGANRTAVFGTSNNVYALDTATGAALWWIDIGGDVDSSPTLADGVLYISSGADGLYAVLSDIDDDGVPDGLDLCPGTLADTIDPNDLRRRHYAWYGGDFFASGGDDDPVYTLSDTRGCSAEQIITKLGLGQGHSKFGLSLGAIRDWIESPF